MIHDNAPPTAPLPETLGIEDAAVLLCVSPDCLMRKARAGRVPGAKVGRRWVFVRADLIELIREQAKARALPPINVRALRGSGFGSRSDLADRLRAQRRAAEKSREIERAEEGRQSSAGEPQRQGGRGGRRGAR